MKVLLAIVSAVFICGSFSIDVQAAEKAAAEKAAPQWSVPNIDALPDDDWGRTVRYGRDLAAKTSSLLGPETKDPSKRFSGNNLNCQSCHIEGGTKQFGLPYVGVFADFPQYRGRSGSVGTIEDRINGCMVRSMNGKPLPLESKEMTAMVAYMKFLSTRVPVGAKTEGRGPGITIPELTRPADPQKGSAIYAKICVVCHQANGLGKRVGTAGDAAGYTFPPLWGPDSFNDGAGMGRLITAANFIHSNMPHGTTWQKPVVSVEDAWDVAAFIVSKPRPHRANLDKDYPNKFEKPVDSAYGPYVDDVPALQHKYGPFKSIRDADAQAKANAGKP